jgi:predicted nucleic acid-binding protein
MMDKPKIPKFSNEVEEAEWWYQNREWPVTLAIAEQWGELAGRMKAAGLSRPVIDALLAATALRHDLVLVTQCEGL